MHFILEDSLANHKLKVFLAVADPKIFNNFLGKY